MAVFIELFLLGVGLSMDAFAVSVCKGLGMRKLNKKQPVFLQAVQTVDKALLLQGFAIVGTAFLI